MCVRLVFMRRTPSRRSAIALGFLIATLAVAGCSSSSAESTASATDGPRKSSPRAAASTPAPLDTTGAPLQQAGTAGPPSSGCSVASGSMPVGQSEHTLTVAGAPRTFSVIVPTSYSGNPTPVVVSMHGLGSNSFQQLVLTGIKEDSETNGYIVVAPDAAGGVWQLPLDGSTTASADVDFISAAVGQVESQLCVDTTRSYASGMSLGSAMTFLLACQPQPMFAAFGGVGASFYRPVCDAAPPAPIIYFHGTDDQTVPFAGGIAEGVPVDPVPTTVAAWAAHNQCSVGPTTTQISDVTQEIYSGCAANANVDFYQVNGGGHTWPGAPLVVAEAIADSAGITTQAVDATSAMWQFFSQYQQTPSS